MEPTPPLALFNTLFEAIQFATKVISEMFYFKWYVPNAMGCGAAVLLFVSYGL